MAPSFRRVGHRVLDPKPRLHLASLAISQPSTERCDRYSLPFTAFFVA